MHAIGRYQPVGLLAEGGMASVYLAVQKGGAGTQRLAVVKVVRRALADNRRETAGGGQVAVQPADDDGVVRGVDFGRELPSVMRRGAEHVFDSAADGNPRHLRQELL